ncbi:hypothetical protein QAD02_011639 [Eretmocerus hayati]|uniref:Uncharacterized protein n=1 Tax=Eretmocerus hayati TaxID=131215 RepID=A0ACC2NYB0_9HYME|nr:hypothetical protein QAD02_011639 [Eretmocerus hayati]
MKQTSALSTFLLVYTCLYFNERQVHSLIIYDVGERFNDACQSQIYCEGDLLHAVQLLKVFEDSKTFVDLPMKESSEKINKSFHQLIKETSMDIRNLHLLNGTKLNQTRNIVRDFVKKNFGSGKDLLKPADLSDWRENPKFFETIQDNSYQEWARNLNKIWKELARKMSEDVKNRPDRHSLIYVDKPFVVSGGRFNETYYWDTYWVIEGLLLCDMHQTVRGIIENLLSMVEKYHFVPNGGRIYYLSRSQPPLLIPMVDEYLKFTGDREFALRNLGTLEREFQYWMKYKSVKISENGKNYTLSRYVTNSSGPRPESYKEDYKLATKLSSPQKKFELYNNLKAGAESGWDFSSRWFAFKNNTPSLELDDIVTSEIIPVDLNAFIQRNARILSKFFNFKNDSKKAGYYKQVADDYQDAIRTLMWNEEDGTWYDLDMKHATQRKQFYLSNLTPLYTQSYDEARSDDYAKRSVEYLQNNGMSEYLGMPTSLSTSARPQQWDFPNVWAPLQSIVVEGLINTNNVQAVELAKKLAFQFLKTTFHGYQNQTKMFEKGNGEGDGLRQSLRLSIYQSDQGPGV